MACTSQSMIYANSCVFPSSQRFFSRVVARAKGNSRLFVVNASAGTEESDCNTEECAPDKEVGKVSMEWLAGEKTKVVGTFPPKKKGWTGYVEKDTAGQTNIYSVEPTVYVAESAISSGNAGTSSEGSENTVALAAGLALVSVAVASFTLLQVSKNQPQVRESAYSGPPLSYYINKFKPVSVIEASMPAEPQTAPPIEALTPPEPLSSTAEASVPSEPQVPITIESDNNVQAAPEIAVELKEQVEAQSSISGNAS